MNKVAFITGATRGIGSQIAYTLAKQGYNIVVNYRKENEDFENTKKNEIWMFARVKSVTWEFRFSKDEGDTWSEPATFLKSDAGGLFYFDVRKQIIPTERANSGSLLCTGIRAFHRTTQ